MATPLDETKSKRKHKTLNDHMGELRAKRARIQLGGGKERIDKQHAAGKLSARERIDETGRPRQLSGNRPFRRASLHLVRHGRERDAR